jgi:hypothetical protein
MTTLAVVVGVSSALAGEPAFGTIGPAAVSRSDQPFGLTSSIDGKRVLPVRSRWLAYPKLPTAQIKEVDYLIDGKLRWIERKAPYNYGSDDFHGHLGYLITTFLTPGRHTFAARAIDSAGRKATDTVTARVVPAPEPPAELKSVVWKRTFTGGALPGEWELTFDTVGSWHLDPIGGGVVDQYDIAGNVLHLYAPITFGLRTDSIKKLGHNIPGGGSGDCREDGPFGSYHWSVTGDELTLTPIKELCAGRGSIISGTWTRAG